MAKKVAKKSAKPAAPKASAKAPAKAKVAKKPAIKKAAQAATKPTTKPNAKPTPKPAAKGTKKAAPKPSPKPTKAAAVKSAVKKPAPKPAPKAKAAAKATTPAIKASSETRATPPAKPATKPIAKVAEKPAATPAPKAAKPSPKPISATVEAKPSTKLPAKPSATIAAAAEPVYPIAPPSGQRDVDLATAIQKSRMFYAGHGLGALAGAIPSAADFPPEANAAIEDAHAVGLDDVFVFPPLALQRDSLAHLVHRLATASSDRVQGDQQFGQPWIYQPDALKTFAVHGRPEGAYALCFYSGSFPAQTGGKDAGELRDWLDQRRCATLTVYEYLVLQRIRAEQHGDHRFDLNAKDHASQWHWLLDMSLGEGKDAKYPMAGWNPKMRRIELGWCGPRDASPGKGAHPTRVVPARAQVPNPA